MIQTQWNQGAPYNNNCPVISETRTVTGCVATAMAQVMKFHQYPTETTLTIPGYTTTTKDKDKNSYSLTVAGLDATTFSWSDMTSTYTSSSTGTAADAVAKLMQYCGVSLHMRYGLSANGGSSAYNANIPEALKVFFGYDGTTTYAQRQHYSYAEWVDMIYAELAASRPVILGGQSTGGGHSFVCDGYASDDYFHINWGWGGSSDGYFRLSALNPYDQGIGGSSTLDGFSFTQDAVVGIRPYKDTSAALCLSLEKLQFDSSGSTTTQVINRDNTESAFTISSLYLTLCNYLYTAGCFDYAVVLTNGDGTTNSILAESDAQSMTFNSDNNIALSNIATPEALTNGTYYIKVMSRVYGTTDWQECYDGAQQQITAVVNENTLTLTAPIVRGTKTLPTSVSFSVSGTPTVGYEQTVIASVTGNSVDYYGNLILRVDGVAVMGKSVEIPAGKTVDVTFAYIPSEAGEDILTLWDSKSGGTQISGSNTIIVVSSDATTDLDLTCTYSIDNVDTNGKLYGNGLRATVTISNASTEKKYVGVLNCSARQWTSTTETVDDGNGTSTTTTTWEWQSLGVTHYALEVDKNGSTVVNIAADDLPTEGYYSFRLSYRRITSDATVADLTQIGYDDTEQHGTLQITEGYSLTDATGTKTIYAPSTSIDAGSAAFVDLSNLSSLEGVSVTSSSNPNCVYLLKSDATTPSGLSGKNVVKGTTAETLTLTDGYDFYTPVAFTATSASYTRTFDLAAAGSSGWSTLSLPFAPTSVTVNNTTTNTNRTVTWFNSDSDTNGSFWLREFSSDTEGSVTFDYVQQMKAYTPYIIAVPGDTWGETWKMTGYPVTFTASDVNINATALYGISGNTYKFCGNTIGTTLTNCYVLNTNGSKFVKKTSTTTPAFRAWFAPISITSLSLPSLSISQAGTNAIAWPIKNYNDSCNTSTNSSIWYSLDGQKHTVRPHAPGIYIHKGQKIIIK